MGSIKQLCFLAFCVLAVCADDKGPVGPIQSSTKASNVTTTPSTTTPATTSTSAPTTTSTTTTPAPTTTPPKTTTSTAKPTTTTVKPTTTTVKPTPTTTVKPTPTPDPTAGQWFANYTGTNKTCIVLDVAIQIAIPYQDQNKTNKLLIDVPPEAKATGVCVGDTQSLTLNWSEQNVISFRFNKTVKDKTYNLQSVKINVTIPGQDSIYLVHEKNEFSTPLSKSYKCAKIQNFVLTQPADKTTNATLQISHLQVQAFRNQTGTGFNEVLDCADSETPDVVPIAVGCALAALVIIVLFVYLIGRRRSQARGYLSMFTENKREEDYIPMKNLSCFS